MVLTRAEAAGVMAVVVGACVGFAVAPVPPPAPTTEPESAAAIQRGVDLMVERMRAWQVERGDLSLPWDEASGHLALVIDDVGRELDLFEQLLALRFRLSFSVLPGAVYAAGAQLRGQADGRRYRELLLHLPMEPENGAAMREGDERREVFLLDDDEPSALAVKLARALDAVPLAVGVNNHMGSRLTTRRGAMDVIMAQLAERGLYFIDSRTTAATVAETAAMAAGVPTARRDVFLDNDPREAAIETELEHAARLARTRPVIAIAHPSAALVSVLKRRLPELHRQGVAVYPVSTVLGHRRPTPRSE